MTCFWKKTLDAAERRFQRQSDYTNMLSSLVNPTMMRTSIHAITKPPTPSLVGLGNWNPPIRMTGSCSVLFTGSMQGPGTSSSAFTGVRSRVKNVFSFSSSSGGVSSAVSTPPTTPTRDKPRGQPSNQHSAASMPPEQPARALPRLPAATPRWAGIPWEG